MFKNRKSLRIGLLTFTAIGILTSGAYAGGRVYRKKLNATFGTINFNYEGQDVTANVENKYKTPGFIVEGRSYVPVKALGEVLGLDVSFDNKSHTVFIKDPKNNDLDIEIRKRDREIADLKREISSLKGNMLDDSSLEYLEDRLAKTYKTYKNIDFDLKLFTRTGEIEVNMYVDFKDSDSEISWNKMGESSKRYMVEDIVRTVSDEFPDKLVRGKVYDRYNYSDLLAFEKIPNRDLKITYYDITDSSSLERFVKAEFRARAVNNVKLKNIYEKDGRVYFRIDVSDKDRSMFKSLRNLDVEEILDSFSVQIAKEYPLSKLEVEGEIYLGSSRMGRYFKNKSSDLGIYRK